MTRFMSFAEMLEQEGILRTESLTFWRHHFAGLIIQSLIASRGYDCDTATDAVKMADALILALNEKPKQD